MASNECWKLINSRSRQRWALSGQLERKLSQKSSNVRASIYAGHWARLLIFAANQREQKMENRNYLLYGSQLGVFVHMANTIWAHRRIVCTKTCDKFSECINWIREKNP